MLPCPNTIWNEFIRPRTHPGITRCPATQSSDPAIAQATPASAAHAIKAGTWRMNAIANSTTATIAIAIEVIAFAETRGLRYGSTNTAPANDPTPTLIKTRPSWAAEHSNSFSAITGKSAGTIEITSAKSMFRKRMIFMRCELRAYRSELMNDSVKFSRSPVDCIWRGLPGNMARATTRNASALNEMSSGARSSGSRKPARAGPTIRGDVQLHSSQRDRGRQLIFANDVRDNGSPNRGAKRKPNPEREDASKHRVGVDHLRPRAKSKERGTCSLP